MRKRTPADAPARNAAENANPRPLPPCGPARVLGIDPSLRCTGVAVIEARGNALTAIEAGCIKMAPSLPLSACLCRLSSELAAVIAKTGPQAAAIEAGFFAKNARTAMLLGSARGVVIAACAAAGIQIYEYAPRRVKQAVVGFGGATKRQIIRMVVSLLNLQAEPQEDAGDALAVAICHLHCRTRYAALMPTPI